MSASGGRDEHNRSQWIALCMKAAGLVIDTNEMTISPAALRQLFFTNSGHPVMGALNVSIMRHPSENVENISTRTFLAILIFFTSWLCSRLNTSLKTTSFSSDKSWSNKKSCARLTSSASAIFARFSFALIGRKIPEVIFPEKPIKSL